MYFKFKFKQSRLLDLLINIAIPLLFLPALLFGVQEFVSYYHENIHLDMDKMANWAFREYGFTLMTSNQAEGYNSFLSLWTEGKENSLDMLVIIVLEAVELSLCRVKRGRYGLEDAYTLRPFLASKYPPDPSILMPVPTDRQAVVDRIKARLAAERAVSKILDFTIDCF